AVDLVRHAWPKVKGLAHRNAVKCSLQPEYRLAVGGPGNDRFVGKLGLDLHQKRVWNHQRSRNGGRSALRRIRRVDIVLDRSEEHTSELSHVKISYAVFCLKK